MPKAEDKEELIKKIRTEIDKFNESLIQLENDVENIQTGEWNGDVAYKSVQDCLEQIDYNKKLLIELNKCYNYLESIKN